MDITLLKKGQHVEMELWNVMGAMMARFEIIAVEYQEGKESLIRVRQVE
jgi:hypothetical protein